MQGWTTEAGQLLPGLDDADPALTSSSHSLVEISAAFREDTAPGLMVGGEGLTRTLHLVVVLITDDPSGGAEGGGW